MLDPCRVWRPSRFERFLELSLYQIGQVLGGFFNYSKEKLADWVSWKPDLDS